MAKQLPYKMTSHERVVAALDRKAFDRLPIKHLAVREIDDKLKDYLGVRGENDLLDALGHDFREIRPRYIGPDIGDVETEHGVISGVVWANWLSTSSERGLPFAGVETVEELSGFDFPSTDCYDYSDIRDQCEKYADYATIFGYCEIDFINGLSGLRGNEQVLIDMAAREPVFIELVERRFLFFYRHIQKGLEAGGGLIDLVHIADDLGSQQGLLISRQTFLDLFGAKYRAAMELIHSHGAKAMMHCCGSVRDIIPDLIDLGLDVLDVVQTNADRMDLVELKREFGRDLAFAGTMCVQQALPFGTPASISDEVKRRLDLFSDGGLIIGPSHQIQTDTPVENILAMYEAAGGFTRR